MLVDLPKDGHHSCSVKALGIGKLRNLASITVQHDVRLGLSNSEGNLASDCGISDIHPFECSVRFYPLPTTLLREVVVEIVDEIVTEFLVESYENLDQLDKDLLELEESPNDKAKLSSVFRSIHTIKGTSGFLAYPKLEKVAHVGENLLVKLRDGELLLNSEITSGLLSMVDAIRSMLCSIEAGSGEGEETFAPLIAELERLKSAESGEVAAADGVQPTEIPVEDVVEELRSSEPEDSPAPVVDTPTAEAISADAKPQTPEPAAQKPAELEVVPKAAAEPTSPKPKAVAASPKPSDATSAEGKDKPAVANGITESTIRIEVGLLDKLMNLVGELVLARNEIMQCGEKSEDTALAAASQRVNLITTELQEGVMKTRMQPIQNAWSKLPRVVRDLSKSCGKQVQVKMEGAETELDKTILEAIKDPLTHIVRNSVDHGIESADVRLAAGKPAEGTLLLRAYHEGGQVNIEIIDDGGGISVDRVREKAVEKGLVSEEQAAALTDREASQLILLPGFSTAATVTNVSGRGVGMDVVKTNVEKIGGTLDINSVTGEGTTLRIKIPLTLAIVPALVVTCDEDRFCIPQVNLLELVRLDGDKVKSQIEVLHSVPVYRLRGQLLPLVYLDEELGLRERRTDADRHLDAAVNIVVLKAEDQIFGLVVDVISDTQEIVVKPLGAHLRNLPVYAGSTIMGDGTVSLILDVVGIAKVGHVLVDHGGKKLMESNGAESDRKGSMECYLVVDPGDNTRAAVALDAVARLEEIPTKSIERSGNQQVVQYRGQIMPIVSLSAYGEIDSSEESIPLIVYNTGDSDIGVAVGKILDIVDQVEEATSPDGNSRVIGGKVTRIVDLEMIARSVA